VFPQPEVLADADVTGMPRARAEAIRSLARAVLRGEVDLGGGRNPNGLPEALMGVKGLGDWTAQYIAMRALGQPDAFPAGDLVLRRIAGGGLALTAAGLRKRAEVWRPWRAYAAMYLWRGARGSEDPATRGQPTPRS
jgi:AraC family transcriptional regulator of adaptative response / DNA-3-methyladenine glycosylase II